MMHSKQDSILIVGAGVFGLSTAAELASRGYTDITVVDRNLPPVPDGSSVDVSRVIRPDYADEFYARMGLDAMRGWKNEYKEHFYQSGLLCSQQASTSRHAYLEQSKRNLERLGASLEITEYQGSTANDRFPAIHGDLAGTNGYWNLDAGWAHAEKSMSQLAQRCITSGVGFICGRAGTVIEIVKSTDKRQVKGVRTADGQTRTADTIILATGAWTPHLIESGGRFIATAQPVGFIQLTPEEVADMKDCPVMIDLSSGWFAFPPTPDDGRLKMARHGYGYETTKVNEQRQNGVYSAPDIEGQRQFLPGDAEEALRTGLRMFFPKFQDRPFIRTRLCWYTDTPKGDFIVDHHPQFDNLFLATGGSGHAFKFLPVLGKYVADSFEGIASEEQRRKWAWAEVPGQISKGDGSRGGPPRRTLSRQEQARL